MPFKSDSQRKLCYLLKGKGQAGSWDCDEWSTATGKKKLPEHVEDQTEKKASGLNDVKALCALWAAPSPIKEAAAKSLLSKLSSVITSPGRGSGDIEESAVDPDPSEGMQKAKPMPARMGHRGGNKFVSPKGAARNALMRATKEVFGQDVNNRGIKSAGGPPPGNTLGGPSPSSKPKTKLPTSQGYSPANSAIGAVQPFINAGTNLYNAAAPEMNKLKGGVASVGEGVKAQAGAWGNAKNWLSAKGISDTATGAAKAVGNLSGEAAGAAQGGAAIATDLGQTAGGMFKSIGNAIPGASSAFPQFAKSSAGPIRNILNRRSGGSAPKSSPPPSVNNNSAAEVTTPEPAATTPAVPPVTAAPVNENPPPMTPLTSEGTIEQGQVQPGATFTPAAPTAPATPIQPAATSAAATTLPTTTAAKNNNWTTPADKGKQRIQAIGGGVNTVGSAVGAMAGNADSLQTLNNDANRPNLTEMSGKWDAFKKRTTDSFNNAAAGYTLGNHLPAETTLWNKARGGPARVEFLNNVKGTAEAVSNGLGWLKPVTRAASSAFNDYAANSEGKRIAAGYALPAVNWMNSNPWAKYLGAAALGGLGLYGINKYMGGGNKSKGTGSVLDQNFQQGLASQQPRR